MILYINLKRNGILVLENGETFYGESFAARKISFGEVVFNTSMTGYQEILTDPSYKRQIITMTYPEIGNYGVITKENQSKTIHAHGFLVKNYNDRFYNPESNLTLSDFLKKKKIVALKNLDTRRLTRIIREKGALEAVISSKKLDKNYLLNKLKKEPRFHTFDLASEVSTKEIYLYEKKKNYQYRIGVIDFGVKENILKILSSHLAQIWVFPVDTSAKKILTYNLDGLLLSNGPGDPNTTNEKIIANIQNLIFKLPIFGICFGHQILLKALGKDVFKLKFGHHGANHPIKNFKTQRTSISSQNHGYAIKAVKKEDLEKNMTTNKSDNFFEMNLNDNTIAGFCDENKLCFSVQYHPEGAPGPHDSYYHFDDFFSLINKNKAKNAPK